MNDKIIIVCRILWSASFGGAFGMLYSGNPEAAIWLFVLGIYFIQKMNHYELKGEIERMRDGED